MPTQHEVSPSFYSIIVLGSSEAAQSFPRVFVVLHLFVSKSFFFFFIIMYFFVVVIFVISNVFILPMFRKNRDVGTYAIL